MTDQDNITGRDGYILMQALAYAIRAIEALPEERQEWSNMQDMRLLLEAFCPEADRRQWFLDQAQLTLKALRVLPGHADQA